MPTIETVLVLGAYGLVGREVTAGLLAKTDLRVIASGRSLDKLTALDRSLAHPRLSTRSLDAYDGDALSMACGDADLVINAVGPYAKGGAEIARAVLEAERPYVDFANEQSHYQRLEALDAFARRCEQPLLTGAGLVPGLSTLMVRQGASRLPRAQEVAICYAQGRAPDAESGLGSFLGFIVELSLLGGRFERRFEAMPAPFGDVQMVSVPTLEALTVPKRLQVRSVENWWALGEVPPGTGALIRLLKPHQRNWGYRFFHRLTRWAMRDEYRRAVKKGLTTEGALKVVVRSPEECWQATARVEDGGRATAYLPVLAATRFAEGRLDLVGLGTPLDVFEPDATFNDLAALGWNVDIAEQNRRGPIPA